MIDKYDYDRHARQGDTMTEAFDHSMSVNSAKPTTPVNKYGEPETEVTAPNWERLKIDVRERIDALAGIMSDRCSESPELKARIWSDLIRPNVKLLAEFCSNVSFDGEREPQ